MVFGLDQLSLLRVKDYFSQEKWQSGVHYSTAGGPFLSCSSLVAFFVQ